jgi:DHA1 family multidrug resistance protein-like MFS transporter
MKVQVGLDMNNGTRSTTNVAFWTLCIMGGFAILSSTMSKSPALNPFSNSLGTPDEWSGFVSSASTIPGILISLPAASLSDIFGRKKFLILAAFVFASAPFLYLFITVWWQLILIRFYHGFATGIFVPVAEASVAELFPTKRGERISLFTSATYVGRLAAPLLGTYILVMTNSGIPYTNFHELYLAVAVAGVTAFIMILPFLVKKSQPTLAPQKMTLEVGKQLFHGWKTVVKNRGVLVVSLVQASQYYAYGAFEFYLTGYLTVFLRYSIVIPGLVATCIIGVAIFVKPYMGRVSDKIGRRIPIVMGYIISAIPLLVIPFVTDFVVLILLAIVYGFGFAAVTASTPALISELVPKELVGTSMGFLDMIMDVGQTLGPIISGFILATYLQYHGLFPSLAFVLLISCLIFVVSGVAKTKSNANA